MTVLLRGLCPTLYPPPTCWGGVYRQTDRQGDSSIILESPCLSVCLSVRLSGFVRSITRSSCYESCSNVIFMLVIMGDCALVILVMFIWPKKKLQHYLTLGIFAFKIRCWLPTAKYFIVMILHWLLTTK